MQKFNPRILLVSIENGAVGEAVKSHIVDVWRLAEIFHHQIGQDNSSDEDVSQLIKQTARARCHVAAFINISDRDPSTAYDSVVKYCRGFIPANYLATTEKSPVFYFSLENQYHHKLHNLKRGGFNLLLMSNDDPKEIAAEILKQVSAIAPQPAEESWTDQVCST